MSAFSDLRLIYTRQKKNLGYFLKQSRDTSGASKNVYKIDKLKGERNIESHLRIQAVNKCRPIKKYNKKGVLEIENPLSNGHPAPARSRYQSLSEQRRAATFESA